MKFLILTACVVTLAVAGFTAKASAAEPKTNVSFNGDNGVFPIGKTNDAYAQYFTGTSYLQMLTTEGVTIANVSFEPGCRNFWHIHHKGGQILLVTEGRGWYQDTTCDYCAKVCHNDIGISGSFTAMNFLTLYKDEAAALAQEQWLVGAHGKKSAAECIECGECEKVCPQHIAIREELAKVHSVFSRIQPADGPNMIKL